MVVFDRFFSFVALDRSSYTVTLVLELACPDSVLVVLDKWSSYRSGLLNRFDRFDCMYINSYIIFVKFVKYSLVFQVTSIVLLFA